MASKGTHVLGTDGTDYRHRQRVVTIHSASADSKRYLKLTFYPHFFLYVLIILKLSEDILDRADIFILELQELRIPKPDLWEWTYGLSFLGTAFGARAMKTNSAKSINMYQIIIWLFALVPILLAQFQYAPDFIKFINERDVEQLTYTWRSLPLAVIFEAFAMIALQVHLAQAYFAYKLWKIWSSYGVSRAANSASVQTNKKTN
ncbi:hypothetical protein RDWZM_008393 [Blomia tropicalis]|uniref:Uncharacterized protein n=1 Tax=Blomia tropicalis TaxID=40697 RepID=A0A9Q0RK14_BLOTA|nr:hypothetical protein RDWZM_008393 [Blomia tropicalis]